MTTATLDAGPLLKLHGLADGPVPVVWTDAMPGLEADARDDWLHVGLMAMRLAAAEGCAPRRMALIGSGNGIDAIAAARIFPALETVVVTDVIGGVLDQVVANIKANTEAIEIRTATGRDCEPLDGNVDVIYGNLPLLMVEDGMLDAVRATTTLVPAGSYAHLAQSGEDTLARYSLLSQLGFLRSAIEHLAADGVIVTLIGGRVPDAAVAECFARAGLVHRALVVAFMAQSDAEFLAQYAEEEQRLQIRFEFYDYGHAAGLLADAGLEAPGILEREAGAARSIIAPARLDAVQAHARAERGERVGHLAVGYLARPQ